MKIVVPLAGPDFERDDDTVKAMVDAGGKPLLRRTIEGRPWWRSGQIGAADLIFVVRDTPASQRFARDILPSWFPGSTTVSLGRFARGAALSALAGLALAADPAEVIGVDLVDIDYASTLNPVARFAAAPDSGGIALVFPSSNPIYSYLRTDAQGRVVEAAEKRVISTHASAGTYFFANLGTYLVALAHSLDNEEAVTHRDLFFVCPLMNGVIAGGREVLIDPVDNVVDIKVG